MLKCKALVLGAIVGLGLVAPVVAQDAGADTVVATVGGVDITLGHMIAVRMNLSDRDKQLPDQVIFEGILERLIQQSAVSQSMTELTVSTRLKLENERRALIASEVVNGIAEAIEITEEAVQAAYDLRFTDFTPAKEYNASHILVKTEEEAATLVTELAEGADFAELAKERSTGPSGPSGGQLGWFGAGQMVPEFENAVFALVKDQVSAPVQTQFGWHVIRLNDTREAGAPSLQELKGELETEVWQAAMQAAISGLVDSQEVIRPDVSGFDPAILRDESLIGG